MQEEITLRQHWFVVPELGRTEQEILTLLDAEEGDREVQANLEANNGSLHVRRIF